MLGALLLYNVYVNLGEECRDRIIGNIFNVNNVLISDFVLREKAVIVRFFAEGKFYQFVFDFTDGYSSDYSTLSRNGDVIYGYIAVYRYPRINTGDLFSILLEIFLCQDEVVIYRLIRRLL